MVMMTLIIISAKIYQGPATCQEFSQSLDLSHSTEEESKAQRG